ncbi:hypothetical protein RND81_01G139500 [Saponaria officinalis]|uniref:beta-amyrin 28-monooxygenase n=1 Tax=Saponaria officinalis TaxID=3572 RepID=A0AAW1NF59_SAPOF
MELSTLNTIILTILGSCSIAILFYHLYYSSSNNNKSRLPPGNLGLPFVGETLHFMRAGQKGQPEKFILDRMTKHSPIIFKTSILGEPTAVTCGAAGHKFTFGHEDKLFVSWWPKSVDLIFPTTNRTSSNEETKRLRRLLPQFLKPEALKRYVGVMDKIVNRHIGLHWEGNDVVYVYSLAKNLSFWVACRVFLSMDDPVEVAEFEKPFETLADGIVSLPVNLPGTRLNRAIKAAKQVREEIRRMIESRRRDLAKGIVSQNQDIMSHMLVTKDEEDGQFMSDDEISDKLLALLFGGHQTTSVAITFVIKFLAELPRVFHAVYQEQMEIARSKRSDEGLKWEDIQKMKYTWNVACEALRLAPPVQGAFRVALQDFSYAGFHIPKGWKIYWNAYSTHKNPDYFQNPEEFDPTRFEGEGPKPYTYVPFGGGPRMCPGMEFARLEILVFMHNIVTRFHWKKLFPNEMTTFHPIPLPLKVLPICIYLHPS